MARPLERPKLHSDLEQAVRYVIERPGPIHTISILRPQDQKKLYTNIITVIFRRYREDGYIRSLFRGVYMRTDKPLQKPYYS